MKAVDLLGSLILSITFCAVVSAQSTVEKCVVRGWVRDAEPRKDIYIYSGPGEVNPFKPYDIIGHLDNSTEPGEEKPVEIIGFRLHPRAGSWIEIRQAGDLSGKVLFQGDGWLPAERVIIRAQSRDGKPVPLYFSPRLTGRKAALVPDKAELAIIGFDCFGLKVRYRNRSGWLPAANICGEPNSSCGRE